MIWTPTAPNLKQGPVPPTPTSAKRPERIKPAPVAKKMPATRKPYLTKKILLATLPADAPKPRLKPRELGGERWWSCIGQNRVGHGETPAEALADGMTEAKQPGGWARQQTPVTMPGSRQNSGKLRHCPKCEHDTDVAGGVELRPGVWRCAACWKARSLASKPKR